MTKRLFAAAYLGLALSAGSGASLFYHPGRAAAQAPSREVLGRLPTAGEERESELRKHFATDKNTFGSLANGAYAPTTAEHQAIIETAAKWFVYRLTWDENLRSPGAMQVLLDEFDREVLQPAAKARESNEEFRKQFCQQLIIQLKKVLNNDIHVNRVRGGLMLRRAGLLGRDEMADLMAGVLEDKNQFPEIKLFAVQGLNLMFTNNMLSADQQARALQTRCIQDLLNFFAAEANVTDVTAAPEVGAIRFLRKNIIEALGAAKLPRTKGDKQLYPALTLLRVVVQDHITPPPTFEERVMAATALAHMPRRDFEDYQPDYAAYYIAQFIMEFAKQATAAGRSDSLAKYNSAQLQFVMNTLNTSSARNDDISRYIAQLASQTRSVLASVDGDSPPDTTDLIGWLDKTKRSSSLFRGNDKTVVNTGTTLEAAPAAPPP